MNRRCHGGVILKWISLKVVFSCNQACKGVWKKFSWVMGMGSPAQMCWAQIQSLNTWMVVSIEPQRGHICWSGDVRKILSFVGSWLWAHLHINILILGRAWILQIQRQEVWVVGFVKELVKVKYADFTVQTPPGLGQICSSWDWWYIGIGVALIRSVIQSGRLNVILVKF